jgi:hypothetical protein
VILQDKTPIYCYKSTVFPSSKDWLHKTLLLRISSNRAYPATRGGSEERKPDENEQVDLEIAGET